jgi:O-antigen ligase
MPASFAVAAPLQGAAVLAAACAAAAALSLRDPRQRAAVMLLCPVLAVLAVATVIEDLGDLVRVGPMTGAALAIGVAAVGALAWLMHRRPAALAVLALAALPFRVPVAIGDSTANLLVPLYAVIAAGVLAYALPLLRAAARGEEGPPRPRLWRLRHVLAAVLVVYALQALYSTDRAQAAENVGFFYVPFALLFLLLLEVRWSRRLLRDCLALTTGLALLFAAIGFVEFATGHLLITNAKVVEANDLNPYFRVNSLFFDPNIYGRYLALTMVLLAAVLLWTRRRREVGAIGAILAILWAGLLFSLSQSSFAALLLGLAVLAALRWRPWPVVAVAGAAAVVGVALVLFAPGALNLETGSERALDRATSGRTDLIGGGLEMVADRPVWGFGSGSFAERYREREHVSSERVAAASHTIPLTVTAEQGVIGLVAYLAVVASALALLFAGLRERLHERGPWPGSFAIGRAAIAAAYAALLLHTLVYAAFLEDPLAWVLLAIAAGLPLWGPEAAATNHAGARRHPAAVPG